MFVLNWLEGLNNNSIVNFFVFLLLFIWLLNIVGIYYLQSKKNKISQKTEVFLDNVGGIYLSLGVLGTFLGITVGLLDFNVSDIDASIPPLLEGLKISFVTSLVGVFCNIFSQKATILFLPRKHSDETYALHCILHELKTNNTEQKKYNHDLLSGLSLLDKDILKIGNYLNENHHELIEYIRNIIEENENNNQKVVEKLEEFGKQLSKQATDHIVEALNKVVSDFNENMVDQFGENFKHLNQGIDNLLAWQENYKKLVQDELKLINTTDEKISDILSNMNSFENGFEAFVSMSASLNNTAEQILKVNDLTIENTNQSLNVISEQKNTNEIVKEQITDISKSIQESSEAIKNDFDSIINATEIQSENNKEQLELLKNIQKEYENTKEKQHDFIKNIFKEAQEELERIMKEHSKSIQNMYNEASVEQKEIIRKTMETYKNETTNALEEIVNVLGNDLATLSEKFVDDYSPLTDKLQKVVNIASYIDIEEK